MKDGEIAKILSEVFDLRPYAIVERFGLKNPIFEATASYGHFGRDHYTKEVEVYYENEQTTKRGDQFFKQVDFFAWEKLDYVDRIKKAFNI